MTYVNQTVEENKKNNCYWRLIRNTVFDPFWRCSNCEFEWNDEDFGRDFYYCPRCGRRIAYVIEVKDE